MSKYLFPTLSLSSIGLSIYLFNYINQQKAQERENAYKNSMIHAKTSRQFSSNESLLKNLDVSLGDDVMKAMCAVDRRHYLPEHHKHPYVDHALPLGYKAVCITPSIVGLSLEFVFEHLPRDGVVLNVGCGSGYVAACFASFLNEDGKVYAVDYIPELVDMAKESYARERDNDDRVEFICSDIFALDIEAMGPFDCIFVGGCLSEVPKSFTDTLKEGGSLILSIGKEHFFQRLVLIRKVNGELIEQDINQVRLGAIISNTLAEEDENWTFYRNLDSRSNDIGHFPNLTVSELKEKCIEIGGIAFNTNGWIKDKLNPRQEWGEYGSENQGLYVYTPDEEEDDSENE
eukprot:TRINITY_DN1989_c0_g1_i1.p1 TRINITY_DN1989_c0_g1~~TRINITY_DN1989_c0_g1_i1.p1  ORF type:complete len:366 (-),score=85.03 TRINITY_DN1989_c0_g1_i1:10-1044(-)